MTVGVVAGLAAGAAGWLVLGGGRRPLPRRAQQPPLSVGQPGSPLETAGPPDSPRWARLMDQPAGRLPIVLAATAAAAAIVGVVGAFVLTAAAVVVLRRRGAARLRAQQAREEASLAEACSALAGELAVGRDPVAALESVAPLGVGEPGRALRRAAAVAALGGDVPAALRSATPGVRAGTGSGSGMLPQLAACWWVSASGGAALATAVGHLAESSRAQARGRGELAAALAGPRATAGLLAALPVVGLAFGALLGGQPLGFLLHRPIGMLCLAVGVTLDWLGLVWTDRLVAAAAEP